MPKILILTTSHGASHRRASEALREAFLELQPDRTVAVVDALEHCARWFRTYYDSYVIPLRYWPSLWRRIENYQHQQRSSGPEWLHSFGARQLFRYIHAFDPDVVIATEVGVCELAVIHKRRAHSRFFLVGLELMDFNRAWIQPEVDLYPVAHPDLGDELAAAGAPYSKILFTGMPIDPVYSRLPERAAVQARLELRSDLPLLLVLFGGTGFGKPRPMLAELKKVKTAFQAVFIAGKNNTLERELRQLCGAIPYWRVLGWVENVHEWMVAADLLLSKPGGATVMEASACGLPLLAFDPLPGNEERTCGWLEKWEIGVWVKSPAQLAPIAGHLLAHQEDRKLLRRRAQSFGRPNAAYDAARAILGACGG